MSDEFVPGLPVRPQRPWQPERLLDLARPDLAENEYEIRNATEPLMVHYRNHRGEYGGRRIRPTGLVWFGVTKWHPEEQWFMDVIDVTNPSAPKHRSFALRDIQFSRPSGGRPA